MSVFNTEDISKYFEGNFYFHLTQGYYIFEGLGYEGLKDNINLKHLPFLEKLNLKITIENKITNEKNDLDFNLTDLNKNYINFELSYNDIQNFLITINLYLDNTIILSKIFDIQTIINEYNNLYNDNFNPQESRLIFLIEDFISKEINLKNAFCFNCTNEDLNNIYQRYNISDFYVIHKMNKLLNFKYLDYKIYSTFLTKKIFKDRDLIVYRAKYDPTKEYNIEYQLIELKEKTTISQFFYLVKNFLNNVNYTGEIDKIYNIDSNKRRIVLYIFKLPKLNSKNYFNFIFQQNLNNIK